MSVYSRPGATLAENPFSPTGNPLPLYRLLIPTCLAVIVAWGMMSVVGGIPARDNVDDVGPSLMVKYENYSETAEQRAFIAYVATAFVASGGVAWFVSGYSANCLRILGEGTAWGLLVALLLSCHGFLKTSEFATMGAAIIATIGLGRLAGHLKLDMKNWALLAWAVAIVVFTALLDNGTFLLLELDEKLAVAFGAVLVALVLITWLAPNQLPTAWPWISAATYFGLISIVAWKQGMTAATMLVLTSLVWREATLPERFSLWSSRLNHLCRLPWLYERRWWLGLAVAVLWIEIGFLMKMGRVTSEGLFVLSVQGIAAGTLLQIGRHQLLSFPWQRLWTTLTVPFNRAGDDENWGVTGSWFRQRLAFAMALFVAAACRGWSGLWFGVCLAIGVMFISRNGRDADRSTTRTGLWMAVLLAVACVPDFDNWLPAFDVFHDGQILSAIWEVEQGEELYTRVFPLRSAKFFLGWLSRHLFPHSINGTYVLESFSNSAAVAGACLVAYAWTRSPLWSLAVGLLVQPGGETTSATWRSPLWWAATGLQVPSFGDGREGVMLLLTGLACEVIRYRHRFWGLVLLSLPAFLSGFDIMTPFLGGVAVAVFCGEYQRDSLITWVIRGSAKSIGYLAAAVGLFSGLLAVWQSGNAVWEFWTIFLDYCRHFSSFCGAPFTFNRLIRVELIGLAAFTAIGAARWPSQSRRRRELWALLTVASSLYWFRALGRSDFGHITGPLHMLHLVWILIFVDLVRQLARSGLGFSRRDPLYLGALSLIVLAATVGETSNPWRFYQQMARIVSAGDEPEVADSRLNQLVSPKEYLWAVDYGLANYRQRRHNPTRHAQLFCVSSPNEQRVTVRDLAERRPAVVVWEWTEHDNIHGLTRQYIIGNHVLRHFRPGDDSYEPFGKSYAVPAEPDWPGMERPPEEFAPIQKLYRLPDVWGEFRWPRLADRIVARRQLGSNNVVMNRDGANQAEIVWQIDDRLSPRQYNYLLLEFAVRRHELSAALNAPRRQDQQSQPLVASLQFSADESFDRNSQTTWECDADGERHRYLVPIGCHPGWTWRSAIQRLRLRFFTSNEVPIDCEIIAPSVIAYDIDDLRND